MAAQEIISHALQDLVLTEGGDISLIVTSDNVQLAKELCGTAVEVAKELGGTAVEVAKELGGTAVGVTKELGCTAIEVTKELCGTAVEITKVLSGPAVKLGAIYAGYRLSKPLIDAAITKVLGGGEREDQEVQEIRPGSSLHVLLCCFTDERFLEVLEDYESGGITERLQKEFSEVGIEVEGLKVKIENMEEVEKTRAAIYK
jgi:hypothetical protein